MAVPSSFTLQTLWSSLPHLSSLYFLVFALNLLNNIHPTQGNDLRAPKGDANRGCSFETQGCTYNIYLTRGSSDGSSSVQSSGIPSVDQLSGCGQADRRVFLDDQAQNDVAAKLDDVRETVTYMRDAHENRLKELEGTIQKLIDSSSSGAYTGKISDLESDVARSRMMGKFAAGNEELMNKLENEFSNLSRDLRDKSRDLLEMRQKLNDTSVRMHEEQISKFKTSKKLLNAENQITMLRRERAVLKNQLKDSSYRLDLSSEKVKTCEAESLRMEDEGIELIRAKSTLMEDLQTEQMKSEQLRAELTAVKEKHAALKARQDRIRKVMKIREQELIACYSAKTSTFCGFEDPKICGFTNINDTSDFFDWQRAQGKTPSGRTGPSKDHTCDGVKGHFMFIEASAKGRGSNAILYSPLYRGMTEQCVEFYYHMYGRHTGTLNVYAQVRGDALKSAWRAYGNQGDHWTNARLAIPKELARAGYQIAFEGITQNGYQGDISIDDVSVTDGPCPTDETVVPVSIDVNSTAIIKTGSKFARKLRRKQKRRRGRQNGRKKGRRNKN